MTVSLSLTRPAPLAASPSAVDLLHQLLHVRMHVFALGLDAQRHLFERLHPAVIVMHGRLAGWDALQRGGKASSVLAGGGGLACGLSRCGSGNASERLAGWLSGLSGDREMGSGCGYNNGCTLTLARLLFEGGNRTC